MHRYVYVHVYVCVHVYVYVYVCVNKYCHVPLVSINIVSNCDSSTFSLIILLSLVVEWLGFDLIFALEKCFWRH
jgi:hypothetical protein